MPVINPKELTNEELEYIIKTGQLPPRLNQQPEAPSSRPQSVSYSLSKHNSERKEEFKKTKGSHPLLQSYIGYGAGSRESSKEREHPNLYMNQPNSYT